MDDQEARIHRTWVQLLVDSGQKEAAAIATDTELFIVEEGYNKHLGDRISVQLQIPTAVYGYVKNNDNLKEIFEQAITEILLGRSLGFNAFDENSGNWYERTVRVGHLAIVYHVQFILVQEGWKDTIRTLIASSAGVRNQAAITELMFGRQKKEPILYNGLKFASQSEIRIAQEFVQRKVLFFPLAVGVRADTGQHYKDQREVDFLVCHNGAWGVLEISGPGHDGRFAADAEKDAWLKQSGILCIEHRTAEQCYNNPKKVTDEFLSILAKYNR